MLVARELRADHELHTSCALTAAYHATCRPPEAGMSGPSGLVPTMALGGNGMMPSGPGMLGPGGMVPTAAAGMIPVSGGMAPAGMMHMNGPPAGVAAGRAAAWG